MNILKRPSIYIPVAIIIVATVLWLLSNAGFIRTEPGTEPEIQQRVTVTEPVVDQLVGSPLYVHGRSILKDNIISWKLSDGQELDLAQGLAISDATSVGAEGSFFIAIAYPKPTTATGTLEIFGAGPGGEEISKITIPVRFDAEKESVDVNVYLSNAVKNPNIEDCSLVFPVARRVTKNESVEYQALEQLLAGHQLAEVAEGYFSNINAGVRILDFSIDNKIAQVNVSRELVFQVGGSCRVMTMQAQIERTLTQFPTITSVELKIDGEDAELVLQP